MGEIFSTGSLQIITLCLMWYLSSAITNNLAKEILQRYRYPVTLSYVQFLYVGGFCFLFGYYYSPQTALAGEEQMRSPTVTTWAASTTNGIISDDSTSRSHSRNPMNILRSIVYGMVQWLALRSIPAHMLSIPPHILPFPLARSLVNRVLFVVQWFVGWTVRLMRRLFRLVRFWLALGLGLHEPQPANNYSGTNGNLNKSASATKPPFIAVDKSTVPHQANNNNNYYYFVGTRIRVPDWPLIRYILPLSVFLISGHIFSSVALSKVPVSFVHTIKVCEAL
jgi:hypothetical protein